MICARTSLHVVRNLDDPLDLFPTRSRAGPLLRHSKMAKIHLFDVARSKSWLKLRCQCQDFDNRTTHFFDLMSSSFHIPSSSYRQHRAHATCYLPQQWTCSYVSSHWHDEHIRSCAIGPIYQVCTVFPFQQLLHKMRSLRITDLF